jgi:hypothetical protein
VLYAGAMARNPRTWALGALACAIAACSGGGPATGTGSAAPQVPPPTLTIFALAELRGQIEPCGCTTDPLGDLARTAKVIAEARAAGPVLVVDAGSTLYSKDPLPPALAAQEDLKADLIARVYGPASSAGNLGVDAVGLGPKDLVAGPGKSRLARQVANLGTPAPAGLEVAPPRVLELGGTKVGVFGVTAPDAVPSVPLTDPVAAGKAAVASLRAGGAALVVGLITARNKRDATQLARDIGGIDVSVLGTGATAPEPKDVSDEPIELDGGWAVVPGNRGQIVSRLDVTVRPGGVALANAIGPAAAGVRIADATERLGKLDADLTAFAKDPSADPTFVAQTRRDRDQVAAELAALQKSPWRIPPAGSYLALTQVRIDKAVACDVATVGAKAEYDKAAGAANLAAAKAAPPPAPVPAGTATYVGMEECASCHVTEAEFWRGTGHAKGWETLEKVNKQFDFDCISCHVTGWDKVGGASMARLEGLHDVQCETCHGPGSLHVAADGEEVPKTVLRAPPADLCASQCHTPEHSDTFELTAYLRDIVGKGHAPEARAKLGDGPTGHELRQAGLAKAATKLGAGCVK